MHKVVIPKSVTEIRQFAFTICEHLKEVVFEDGSTLKTIGDAAFTGCSALEKIVLPEGLEEIGFGSF